MPSAKCPANELFLLPVVVDDHHRHVRDIQQVSIVLRLFRHASNNHRPGLDGQLFVSFEVAVFTCSSQLELALSDCRSLRPFEGTRRAAIVTKTQEGFLRHSEAEVRRPRRTRLGSSTDPTKAGAQGPPRCINQARLTTKSSKFQG